MGSQATKIIYSNNCTFEGVVVNDKPHGSGKISKDDVQIMNGEFEDGFPIFGTFQSEGWKYEGQFKEKNVSGEGVLEDKTNTIYRGTFSEGKLKFGTIQAKNQSNSIRFIACGEYSNQNLQGEGTYQNFDLKFKTEGNFSKGLLNGKGKYNLQNGDYYEGDFLNGMRYGQGVQKTNQFKFEGQFVKDIPHIEGCIEFANGDRFVGKIEKGMMHGFGKYTYHNGIIYEGDFYNNSQWGEAVITYSHTSAIEKYEGQVSEGLYNGIGTIYYSNGVIFKGYFMMGSKNGFGVLIYCKQKYKCLFVMDKLVGKLKKL